MKAVTFIFVCCFFCVIFLPFITKAQNSLTHDTGTLEVTTIENGYIGDNGTSTYGGVVYQGNQNAIFMAGIIFGQNGEGYGNYGFIIEDFYNVIPIAGFDSTLYFNQYAYYTLALSGIPDYRTMVETFSNTGDDFVFFRANISNNTANIEDLYPGIFVDWDIGNFSLNRGGYDTSRNLFYMYENGAGTDSCYYGIMGIAIDDEPMAPNTMRGIVTDSVAWNRWKLYDFMTSTAFDTITTDGDYRMYTCTGPFYIPAGSTLIIDIAIVAGTSLEDLRANAQDAIDYWLIVPVEEETLAKLDFLLLQNYPNPFNPSTKISYYIPNNSFTTIKVYDILGNEIETLVKEEKESGTYELTWYAEGLPSGVYFYQLTAGSFSQTKKMLLIK
jgi:hypothetical protein